MIHHIKRATRHLIFWSLIATAVGLTSVRLLMAGIDNYKAELASQVSALAGTPVSIGRLTTKMRGFNPELVLKDIAVSSIDDGSPTAIQLREIRLQLNFLDLLINRELLPATRVTLVGTKLAIRRKLDGSFAVTGLKASDGQPLWLLQGGHYEMLQSEITFEDQNQDGKTFKPTAVDLAIINSGARHRLNAVIQLTENVGDKVMLAMDLQGNFFEPAQLNGKIFADIKQLKLTDVLADYLPAGIRISSGLGNARLWSLVKNSQLVGLQGDIELKQLHVTRQQRDDLSITQLHTRFRWHQDQNGLQQTDATRWRLDVPKLSLTSGDISKHTEKPWPDTAFSITGDDSAHKLGGFIDRLDLQEAAHLAEFFIRADEQAKLLAQAQLQGQLEKTSVYIDLGQQLAAINGTFTRLGFAPVSGLPGISHFSGQITGSNGRGSIRFATGQARITYPDLFREALVINKLAGAINWRQNDSRWVLSSPLFELDLLSISSKNRLRLTVPKNKAEPPFMDFQMTMSSDDVSQLKHYFPTKVMKQADTDWLDIAFAHGRINQGGILYYGPLGSLKSALFEALLDVDGVELNFAPDWPHLYDLAGRVSFLQNQMICDAYQGRTNNLNLIQATAINPEVGISKQLQVKGEVEGQLPDALHFLQQTPLNKDVGGLIAAINSQGKTKVNLDLDLALMKGGYTKLDGSAQLNQARLQVKAIDLWVNKISGALKFNEQGVYSDTITAATLNRPVNINIKNDGSETSVNVTGRAAIDDLKKQFAMPFWEQARGEMAYQLKLDLPFDNSTTELTVQSDLVGVGLDLPGALAKTGQQNRHVEVNFKLGDEALLPITIAYGGQLQAAIKLNVAEQRLHSAHLLLGNGAVSQRADSGLTLEINQDRLDLAELAALAATQNQTDNAAPRITKLNIHSPQAFWKNSPLGLFDLDIKLEGNYWLGDIHSAFAQGKLQIPVNFDPNGKISLNMNMLDLSALKQLKSEQQQERQQATPLLPENLPLFAIHSRKTLWHTVDLGALTVQTERIANGIAFKQVNLLGTEQKLSLSGVWKHIAGTTKTNLQGALDMPKAGLFLSNLGITKEFKETHGNIGFSLNWNAPPYQFETNDLAGTIDVNLQNGRILSIEPGLGRMLGIVAMAQWSKRLQFDFRDIYEEGLTFNTINGHFKVLNGQAETDDLVVDAIAAKISITGVANFIDKTVDHIVDVTPKSADAVPIAGTIMDNVMTLVTRTLTGEDREGFFLGSQYHIKGQWENMEIIPLHENDGLIQKTWTGITDFPWLQQQEK